VELARFGHGSTDPRTPGVLVERAHSYDFFAAIFFGGRRGHVYTSLAALSGVRPGDRVLDVGCATGYFTRVMAEAAAPGGTALGVDPSGQAIVKARRSTSANCTFAEGVGEALDASDGAYDVVVSSLMMHHLPEAVRPRVIGEMFRVLRPGGALLLADFRPPAGRTGRRLVGAIVGPVMEDNPVHLLEPMVVQQGFQPTGSGDVRPWIRYVRAVKPGPAAGRDPSSRGLGPGDETAGDA
jgi:ubiquinone/menaquinone biosynthesis C-methylase UbiE